MSQRIINAGYARTSRPTPLRVVAALAAAAALATLTACGPLPSEGDALPGSDSAPKGESGSTVDTSGIEPLVTPVPTCKDFTGMLGSIVQGLTPKQGDFEKRSFSGGAEVVECNWVNEEYVAKKDGAGVLTFEIRSAKINAEAYIAKNDAAALAIDGAPSVSLGGNSFAIKSAVTPDSVVNTDGVISVFEGMTVLTRLDAEEGSTLAPTVFQALDAHAALFKALKG